MKKYRVVLTVAALVLCVSAPAYGKHKYKEKEYQTVWCDKAGGVMEHVVSGGSRVDCLTETHAVEVEFLEEVLGYDVFQDITKEHTVKDRFVDYAIKLDGKVAFFIEIKQAGIDLREKHIEQASGYAANAGVSWVALTNGRCWQLYHLTFEDGIQSDLILSADILGEDLKDSSGKISLLHKKSILKNEHEDYYAKIKALSPRSIVQAIFQENALRMIRGHLKRMSGITVEEQDLISGIKGMISAETWASIGDVKVKRKRRVSRQPASEGRPAAIAAPLAQTQDINEPKDE